MTRRGIRTTAVAALAASTLALAGAWMLPFLRGLSFVVRAADLQGVARRLADRDTSREIEHAVRIHAGAEWLGGRAYVPTGASRQTVLLVSGLHPGGIDETRLVAFARELARTRVTVVTPDIPELRAFDISPALTDRITEAALWLAREPTLAPTGRIGLMGISFSGGLSIVAAGRPELRDRLLYVFALGGHDDLPRVLRYLCSDTTDADNTAPEQVAPHDYGVAVVLLNVAEDLVPPSQVPLLRDATRRFLTASSLDMIDRDAAGREFAALRDVANGLPEPSRSLLDAVNDRDVARLAPILLPHIQSHVDAAALSPSKSAPPAAPVFLLHGRGDAVIPARESQHVAERLRGHVPVRLLLTDLVSHAEADRPARLLDVARLGSFWGEILSR